MTTTVYSLISLAFLIYFLLVPYTNYRVDRLRQELFIIRDEMFDDAAAGKISFNSAAYGYARTVMNGMIRFAHRVSISRLLAAACLIRHQDVADSRSIENQVMSASPAADRTACQEYLKRANVAIVMHLSTSPFLLVVLVPLVASAVAFFTGFSLAALIVKEGRDLFARFDALAFEEGKISGDGRGHSLATR